MKQKNNTREGAGRCEGCLLSTVYIDENGHCALWQYDEGSPFGYCVSWKEGDELEDDISDIW